MSVVLSPQRIAELASGAGEARVPTAEQAQVISSTNEGSVLVIAGAGSGKTETMANRVVWLIANRAAQPSEILGLTFTRKAAGELRDRIVLQLGRVAASARELVERGGAPDIEREILEWLAAHVLEGVDLPDIRTYHAFAGDIAAEFGLAAGISAEAELIDEATAWQVARSCVVTSDDPMLAQADASVRVLVEHVLRLDRAAAEHQVSLDRIDSVINAFAHVAHLPKDDPTVPWNDDQAAYADLRKMLGALAVTPSLLELVRAYREKKRSLHLIEFSDMLALADEIVTRLPEVGEVLRARYRSVLLDEVQDTSAGQTHLLAGLFRGASVMAVGDPHQSIYGWRGASAQGLETFGATFSGFVPETTGAERAPRGERPKTPHRQLTLSTAWRNPQRVLDAANLLVGPLRATSSLDLPLLQPRPEVPSGEVRAEYLETIDEEATAVARWMRAERAANAQASAAILFRNRRHMARFARALREHGVEYRIIGIGGLLSTPEVTDVVSTLRCLWSVDAESELVRILAGPRFRIGVRDLAGLREAAQWFSARDHRLQRIDEDIEHPPAEAQLTLVDALDRLGRSRDDEHRAFAGISATGWARMREAAHMLDRLRRRVGSDLRSLVEACIVELRLDIELNANELGVAVATAEATANLDTFVELVAGAESLSALLEWLERASQDDQVPEHVPPPVAGTVQLTTVHAAKGLEWDLVAVPRLVEGEFPGTYRDGAGWLSPGQLPHELRSDAATLPKLPWKLAGTQKELRDMIGEYRASLAKRFADEERRLIYVAITRSADKLHLSGSFWGGQKTARSPSPYLAELAASGHIGPLPETSRFETDPSEGQGATLDWPLDPLGRRAEAVLRAAELVRGGIDRDKTPGVKLDARLAPLLAERKHSESRAAGNAQPGGRGQERISASTYHEVIDHADQFWAQQERPIPVQPFRRTRVGNEFHAWVERRTTTDIGTAEMLNLPWAEVGIDAGINSEELQPLIDAFEASRWAARKPVEVELDINLRFGSNLLTCKLDAVYEIPGETGDTHFEIVDWKTGIPPRTKRERESRMYQLELYRHAYAAYRGIDVSAMTALLFYVPQGQEIVSDLSLSLEELVARYESARVVSPGSES